MPPPESKAEIRERLLPAATVRIYVGDERTGSGFFVGTGAVVTCKHVLKPLDLSEDGAVGMISVRGLVESEVYPVLKVRHVSADEDEDLAVLRVQPGGQNPCVLLDTGLNPGDEVHAFGYTARHNEGVPLTLENEGLTGNRKLFKLKAGRVEHGLSGSPVLNVRTGAVCGVLKSTTGANQALGGYAIPIASLFALSDPIASGNRDFHTAHPEWLQMLPETVRQVWLAGRGSDVRPGSPELVVVITVTPGVDRWEVTASVSPSGQTIGPERVDLNTVRLEVARLFRDWASPDSTWRGRVNRGEEVRLLGKVLATAVLPGEIQTAIERLLSNHPAGWAQVALRFEKEAEPDLEYLPWEHLYIPKEGDRGESYLAREKGFAFTRSRDEEPRSNDAPTAQELSVLLVSARPPGDGEADHAMGGAVKNVVFEARELLKGLDHVTVTEIEPASPSELAAAVEARLPTIIHYVGYGRFLAGADEIALGESGGQPQYIEAGLFSALLADGAPRVAVLQLCDARPSSAGIVRADLAPYAPEVLRYVDALVAYQYPAMSTFAECFNECFYKRLAAGAAVELAVQEGRTALWMKAPDERAFLAPTIAVRRPGGLRLIKESSESSARTHVGAAPGHG